MTLRLEPVDGIGEVRPGDDVAALIADRATLQDGDVVVVTSKIVSKAEDLAAGDRERLLEEQTDRVVAERGGTRIVRTHHGLTMAAAGIDASNVETGSFLPLPPDPDASAREIRAGLARLTGRQVAVVVSDTAGRAWRNGQTDIAIGCAGLVPLDAFAGREDTYGNPLVVTAPAVADEVAGAAELASGKLGRRPVVVVRGLDERLLTEEDGPGAGSIIRPEDSDLFGLGSREAVVDALSGTSRGFPRSDLGLADVLAMAEVPDDVAVIVRRGVVRVYAGVDGLVSAGALRQRILALGRAHGFEITVEVERLP